MKFRSVARFIVVLILLSGKINAQQVAMTSPGMYAQPFMFKQFPEKTICNVSALENLFASNNQVTLQLSSAFTIEGKIISHIKPNPFAETINISLRNLPGAVFTLSRVTHDDGKAKYNGHILCAQSSDAMMLEEENNNYYFIKTEQRLLMTE